MPGLAIGWEYLTGYSVATDPASRQRAEWPPHPGRVFMALAAAWFETGEDPDEGDALRWLETLGDPQIVLPPSEEVSPRKVVTVFVPVNGDRARETFPEEKSGTLQSAPAIARKKADRTFPSVWVGEAPCFLHWPDATRADNHRSALDRLCGKVTRIGHSSSLVRMWLADDVRMPLQSETWVPDDGLADLQTRRVSEGTLDFLDRQFNRRGREEHDRLDSQIAALAAERKAIRGRGASERKGAIDEQLEKLRESLRSTDPRPPIRPKLGLWSGYRRLEATLPQAIRHTDFDSDLLILTQSDGPRLPLVSTLAVTQALRGAVMSNGGVQPPPSWVSGQLDDCQPLRDGRQHLASIPLPHVGSDHADGHLLGVALAFPRAVPRPERGRVLGRFVLEPPGQPRRITLALGSLGVWALVKRDWSESRQALKPETWTAHPRGATTWATVTPAVLDQFPKADRVRERTEWELEVGSIIATACRRIGLPDPLEVDFGTTSWHRGSPRSSVKRRLLRGHSGVADNTTPLGDGFPTYPAKGSNGLRPQLHFCLRFAEPVVGPLLLGAGRFLGYGLCKPISGGAG
jgi:CRISPR-associated protein Csb2